ncbi:ParA family protein [Desulfurobacterium sp.]|uniref:ParA family protein n=1 Tax=Desulfurobacterium sp. TaxID=2004706 RepID=UPI00261B2C49|nr:ParA family protein [Desulfurobacterium sp.]
MNKPAVLCIGNMKGGVGKTTLSLLITRYLALKGCSVLLIDADPQGSASMHCADDELFDEKGIPRVGLHVIIDHIMRSEEGDFPENLTEHVWQVTPVLEEGFWIIPNAITASYYDPLLFSQNLHTVLIRKIIEQISEDMSFDVVVIDSPPYVNAFSASGLVASHSLLIPAEAAPISVTSVEVMLKVVGRYKKYGLVPEDMLGEIRVVPTKVRRTRTSLVSVEYLVESFGALLTSSYLPFSEKINRFYTGAITVERLLSEESEFSKKLESLLKEIEEHLIVPFMSERSKRKVLGGK